MAGFIRALLITAIVRSRVVTVRALLTGRESTVAGFIRASRRHRITAEIAESIFIFIDVTIRRTVMLRLNLIPADIACTILIRVNMAVLIAIMRRLRRATLRADARSIIGVLTLRALTYRLLSAAVLTDITITVIMITVCTFTTRISVSTTFSTNTIRAIGMLTVRTLLDGLLSATNSTHAIHIGMRTRALATLTGIVTALRADTIRAVGMLAIRALFNGLLGTAVHADVATTIVMAISAGFIGIDGLLGTAVHADVATTIVMAISAGFIRIDRFLSAAVDTDVTAIIIMTARAGVLRVNRLLAAAENTNVTAGIIMRALLRIYSCALITRIGRTADDTNSAIAISTIIVSTRAGFTGIDRFLGTAVHADVATTIVMAISAGFIRIDRFLSAAVNTDVTAIVVMPARAGFIRIDRFLSAAVNTDVTAIVVMPARAGFIRIDRFLSTALCADTIRIVIMTTDTSRIRIGRLRIHGTAPRADTICIVVMSARAGFIRIDKFLGAALNADFASIIIMLTIRANHRRLPHSAALRADTVLIVGMIVAVADVQGLLASAINADAVRVIDVDTTVTVMAASRHILAALVTLVIPVLVHVIAGRLVVGILRSAAADAVYELMYVRRIGIVDYLSASRTTNRASPATVVIRLIRAIRLSMIGLLTLHISAAVVAFAVAIFVLMPVFVAIMLGRNLADFRAAIVTETIAVFVNMAVLITIMLGRYIADFRTAVIANAIGVRIDVAILVAVMLRRNHTDFFPALVAEAVVIGIHVLARIIRTTQRRTAIVAPTITIRIHVTVLVAVVLGRYFTADFSSAVIAETIGVRINMAILVTVVPRRYHADYLAALIADAIIIGIHMYARRNGNYGITGARIASVAFVSGIALAGIIRNRLCHANTSHDFRAGIIGGNLTGHFGLFFRNLSIFCQSRVLLRQLLQSGIFQFHSDGDAVAALLCAEGDLHVLLIDIHHREVVRIGRGRLRDAPAKHLGQLRRNYAHIIGLAGLQIEFRHRKPQVLSRRRQSLSQQLLLFSAAVVNRDGCRTAHTHTGKGHAESHHKSERFPKQSGMFTHTFVLLFINVLPD